MAFCTSLEGQTVISMSVYATSAFSTHSLISTVYVVQGVVYGMKDAGHVNLVYFTADRSQLLSNRLWPRSPTFSDDWKHSLSVSFSTLLDTSKWLAPTM